MAEDVVRYLRMSTEDDVDPVARGMVANLDAGEDDAPVAPGDAGHYPGSEQDLRDEVGGGLRALRAAVAALRAGADRVPGMRTEASPGGVLGCGFEGRTN